MCIDNQAEIRAILEAARTKDGKRKVAACFNGHWHLDHQRTINEINPAAGTFQLAAHQSAWMGPGPEAIGYSSTSSKLEWIQPRISALKHSIS